jgi:hypothetical protein
MSDRIWKLPASLARPVARGYLPLEQAYAALIAATLQEERSGALGPYDPVNIVRGLRHVLELHLHREAVWRGLAANRVPWTVKRLIRQRKPSNVLLAEAHGVNGASGFPLLEAEVSDVVENEVWWALPQAVRRQHRVG